MTPLDRLAVGFLVVGLLFLTAALPIAIRIFFGAIAYGGSL